MSEQMYYNDGLVSIGAQRCVFDHCTVRTSAIRATTIVRTDGPRMPAIQKRAIVLSGAVAIGVSIAAGVFVMPSLLRLSSSQMDWGPPDPSLLNSLLLLPVGMILGLVIAIWLSVREGSRRRRTAPFTLHSLRVKLRVRSRMATTSLDAERIAAIKAAVKQAQAHGLGHDAELARETVQRLQGSLIAVTGSKVWLNGEAYPLDTIRGASVVSQALSPYFRRLLLIEALMGPSIFFALWFFSSGAGAAVSAATMFWPAPLSLLVMVIPAMPVVVAVGLMLSAIRDYLVHLVRLEFDTGFQIVAVGLSLPDARGIVHLIDKGRNS